MSLQSIRGSGSRLFALTAWCIMAFPVALAQVDLSNWPQVQMKVTAINASGHLSSDLKSTMLDVLEEGHPSAVQSLQPDTGPQSICVLVDTSSSAKDSLSLVKSSVLRLLQQLPPQDEVCLAAFDVKLALLQRLTMNRDQLPSLVAGMQAGGGTALYDSLSALSSEMVKQAHNLNQSIILFSDGDDNYSHESEQGLVSQLKKSGDPVIYMINLPARSLFHMKVRPLPSYVQTLGGLALVPQSPSDLAHSVEQILEVLRSRYSITYVSPEHERNGKNRRIRIDVRDANKITVHAPEGYYAPSQ